MTVVGLRPLLHEEEENAVMGVVLVHPQGFVIGLHRDFLPSSWGSYCPSYVEVLTLVGSFGLFMTLFLLFCRYLPMVAMAEVKQVVPHEGN